MVFAKLLASSVEFGASAWALAPLSDSTALELLTDVMAHFNIDPACCSLASCVRKRGMAATFLYRTARASGSIGRASALTALALTQCGADINAYAAVGCFFLLDHPVGVVIGQQVVLGSNVVMMHGSTLGSTGVGSSARRHPKVGGGACLGAHCSVLGPKLVGHCSVVASGSLVNKRVPPYFTAVGLPFKLAC